jgi:hypothetical protein
MVHIAALGFSRKQNKKHQNNLKHDLYFSSIKNKYQFDITLLTNAGR